jgi:excisionase family DNA binding protein
MNGSNKIAYSPQEVASATSLSLRTILRVIASGQLKSFKVGRRRIVRSRDLTAFLRRTS